MTQSKADEIFDYLDKESDLFGAAIDCLSPKTKARLKEGINQIIEPPTDEM